MERKHLKTWRKRTPKIRPLHTETVKEKLARARGVRGDVNYFLDPPKEVLHSPYLMNNIEIVAKLIVDALLKKKKIGVSFDCDSDGIFSGATMVRYLRAYDANVYYTYSERSKGHGIEHQVGSVEDDTDLMIILDSSTNSAEACAELKEKGMEIVVLDHHTAESENPNPYAIIVNPQTDSYPNKHLSGAGVVWKTLQVVDDIMINNGIADYYIADEFIDLVGMGMYADMMPVDVLENRHIIIRAMREIKNLGILSILKANKRENYQVNSNTIGFTISPAINGSARMENIHMAIKLLLSDDEAEAMSLAKAVKNLNDERKDRQRKLLESYRKTAIVTDKVVVAVDKEASSGMNGLVANNLAEEFQRPAFVMRHITTKGSDYNTLKGSCRSYAGIDMQSIVKGFKGTHYALGHPPAFGCGLHYYQLQKFIDYLNEALADVTFESVVEYDFEYDAREINTELLRQIEEFDYCTGQGFPQARLLVRNIDIADRKTMGEHNEHVKFKWDKPNSKCEEMDIVKFRVHSEFGLDIFDEDKFINSVDVIGTVSVNVWEYFKRVNGKPQKIRTVTNQIFMDDYKVL